MLQEYDAWGTVNAILKVEKNGSTVGSVTDEIACSAGTDTEALVVLGLKTLLDIMPGGEWVERIVNITSFAIDLYQLKGDLEGLGMNVQEFQRIQQGDIFDEWNRHPIRPLNAWVQEGQEYQIKIGLEASAHSTLTRVYYGSGPSDYYELATVGSASAAGFVESIKISMV